MEKLDQRLRETFTEDRIVWGARISLALIYIWFGGLKLISGGSPAELFVHELWEAMFSFVSFETFFLILGVTEVFLGVLFLFPKLSLYLLIGIVLHMAGTFLPFIVIPHTVWQDTFRFTLEGQYVIKNLATLFLTLYIWRSVKQSDKV